MKSAKCPNCGEVIKVDETKDSEICEFCNTPFVTKIALSQTGKISNRYLIRSNNYYNSLMNSGEKKTSISRQIRPEINVGLAVLLCLLYIFPGVIYIVSTKRKQKEWDENHNIRK